MESYIITECKTDSEIRQAYSIRNTVFVREMQIDPKIERDERDESARHFLAYADEKPVAAARMFLIDDEIRIGRMAVLSDYRRQGVGRSLLKEMLKVAGSSGAKVAALNSQASARLFYAAMGFSEEGEPYIEAGIPHIKMTRPLLR